MLRLIILTLFVANSLSLGRIYYKAKNRTGYTPPPAPPELAPPPPDHEKIALEKEEDRKKLFCASLTEKAKNLATTNILTLSEDDFAISVRKQETILIFKKKISPSFFENFDGIRIEPRVSGSVIKDFQPISRSLEVKVKHELDYSYSCGGTYEDGFHLTFFYTDSFLKKINHLPDMQHREIIFSAQLPRSKDGIIDFRDLEVIFSVKNSEDEI